MRKGLGVFAPWFVCITIGIVGAVHGKVKDTEAARVCREQGGYPMAGRYRRHCTQIVNGQPVVVPVDSLR